MMSTDNNEEIFQAAEALAQSATAHWQTLYDIAKSAGDPGVWALEEAAWNSFRFAENARQLAWQLRDRQLSDERRREREGAMAKLVAPQLTPVAAEMSGV